MVANYGLLERIFCKSFLSRARHPLVVKIRRVITFRLIKNLRLHKSIATHNLWVFCIKGLAFQLVCKLTCTYWQKIRYYWLLQVDLYYSHCSDRNTLDWAGPLSNQAVGRNRHNTTIYNASPLGSSSSPKPIVSFYLSDKNCTHSSLSYQCLSAKTGKKLSYQ